MVMMRSVFWDITPCSPLKVNRRFGGTCRLHLHGLRISQAINQHKACSACYLLHTGYLLGLFFDDGDGGNMFLQNVGWPSTDYMVLCPRR
jgi:hypothetical protein